MTNTNTSNNNTATLAARAASLLTKAAAYGVAEKAMAQAIAARRVYPPMAQDFAEQLGLELPLKTREFVRTVSNLLASSEKPIKGVISKKKGEIISVLAELVAALTDTPAIELPEWAKPKERAKKPAEAVNADGALERANAQAVANEAAEALATEAAEALAESKAGLALDKAIALIAANVAALTNEQRSMLRKALEATEAHA